MLYIIIGMKIHHLESLKNRTNKRFLKASLLTIKKYSFTRWGTCLHEYYSFKF